MTAQGFLGELYVTIGVDSSGLANATVAVQNMRRATESATNGANNALNSTGVAATKAGNSINNSMNSISNNLYRFGTFATMAFTLPLTALATLGTKSAMELEQIKQKTVALANVSQVQMDAWSGAITRIGIATNATSKDIAQALYFVSSAGVDNANAMKMVEYAAKGSAAGLGETDVIAKLLTYTYNAYGKEAFDVVKIMDSLTVAVREGAAEAGDIAAVMGDLIPIGAQLGVSFEQLAGSLAAMTQVGMNAHKSATALRQIMVQLIKPHHDAAEALDKAAVKMNNAGIASRNLTATIANKGLLETLVMIKDAAAKMGPMFLPTVFSNVRAFNGFMAQIGPNLDKVRLIMKKTTEETGAFENALSIMTQTSEFKFGQFKKAWELAMLNLGQGILPTLLPMLQSLTKTINDLVVWFKSLSSAGQEVALTIGIILAALGPVTIALSGFARLWTLLGLFWASMIIPTINAIGTALIWLSGIMAANTFTVFTIAALAFVGAAIYLLATYNSVSKELTAGQKAVNDVTAQAVQNTIAEKVAIDQLMRVATNENASREQKQKAIKTINAINPEYLEGINQETIRTGEATAAIGRYLTMLTLKATKEAAYAALVEVEKRRAMALASGSDRELTTTQKYNPANWSQTMREQVATENANKATKDHVETVQKLSNVLNEIPIELQRVEQASVRVAKTLSIFPVKNSISDPVTYYTTKQYIEDMVSGMTKFNLIINNSKPGKIIPLTPPELDGKDPYTIYLKKLAEIRLKTSLFGTELKGVFDAVSETLSTKKTYLDSLIEKGGKATDVMKKLRDEIIQLQAREEYSKGSNALMPTMGGYSDPNLKLMPSKGGFASLIANARDQVDYEMELKKIQNEYTSSIDKNDTNQISNRRNAPWKIDTDNFKAYVNMMKQYRNLEKERGDQAGVDKWQKKIDLAMKPTQFQAGFQKFNAYFQQIGQGINTMISSYVDMINIKQNAAYAMIDKIAKMEGRSAEWVAKQKEKIDADYNRKKRQAAIAQAIINGAMAVTNIIANTPGSVLNPLSWVGIGIAAATTTAQIAVIAGQKMAMGGVVPSGYNNDTYPALLSSGETVIPARPNALSSSMIGVAGNQTIYIKGKLVAEGTDLVYVFDKKYKLMKSY